MATRDRQKRRLESSADATWTRQICLRLRQDDWDRIESLIGPSESYAGLIRRSLLALEHCAKKKIPLPGPTEKT